MLIKFSAMWFRETFFAFERILFHIIAAAAASFLLCGFIMSVNGFVLFYNACGWLYEWIYVVRWNNMHISMYSIDAVGLSYIMSAVGRHLQFVRENFISILPPFMKIFRSIGDITIWNKTMLYIPAFPFLSLNFL